MFDSEVERMIREHSARMAKGETMESPGTTTTRGVTSEQLNEYFRYHAPKDGQLLRYMKIRDAAREFAQVIVDNTPAGADQSAAIRELRLCMMTANASIALEP